MRGQCCTLQQLCQPAYHANTAHITSSPIKPFSFSSLPPFFHRTCCCQRTLSSRSLPSQTLCLFNTTGCGPIPWVVLSEILPPRIKGPAASLATAAGWLGNLLVTLSFDRLLSRLGIGGAYLMYALLNAGAAWYVAANLVETKMKSLQVGVLRLRGGGREDGRLHYCWASCVCVCELCVCACVYVHTSMCACD